MIAWPAVWAWIKGLPREVWIFVLAAIGIYVIREDAKRDTKREARLKEGQRELQTRERATEYVEKVKEEAANAAEQAIERRDTASPLDPERMPDAQRDRIFGRNRAPKEGG